MPIFVYKHFNVLLLLLVVTCLLCGSVRGNKKKSHHLRQRESRGVQEGNVYSSLHWQALRNKRGVQIEKDETYEYYTDDDGNIPGDGDDNGDDYDLESEPDESYDVSITEMENDKDNDDDDDDHSNNDGEDDGEEEEDEEEVDGEVDEKMNNEDPVLDDDDNDDKEDDNTETSSPTTHQNSQSIAPTSSPVKKKSKHKNKQQQEEQSDMSLSEYTDDGQISTLTPTVSPSIVPLPTAPPNPATSIPTSWMDKSHYMHSRIPTVSPTNRNSMKSITTHAPTPLPTLVVEPMTEAPTVSLTLLKKIATNAPTALPTREPTSNNIMMDDDYYTNDFNLEPTPSLPTTQMKSSDTVIKEKDNNNNGSGDDMMDKIYEVLTPEEIEYLNHHKFLDEEKEAAKISAVYFIVTLFLMIFTAHQLSENPDGVYSNMCRLAMTVTGCVLKIFLFPFRKICGFGTRQGYSHHLVVSNDPYNSGESISRMEMI